MFRSTSLVYSLSVSPYFCSSSVLSIYVFFYFQEIRSQSTATNTGFTLCQHAKFTTTVSTLCRIRLLKVTVQMKGRFLSCPKLNSTKTDNDIYLIEMFIFKIQNQTVSLFSVTKSN